MARKRKSNKKSPFQKFLFVAALIFISFLCYRTFIQNVSILKIPGAKQTKHKDQVFKPTKGVSIDTKALKFPPVLFPQKEQGAGKPKIAFVIDDVGHNTKNEFYLKRLGSNITYAILPKVRYSAYFARVAHEAGADVILHQPLESAKGTYPGPGLITQKMSEKEIKQLLSENLDEIPHVIGANNHMGSLGSSDPRIMDVIIRELKTRDFFYLDSRTTPSSPAPDLAKKHGVPILLRDVFLDNEDAPEPIRVQLRELKETARLNGAAVGIGHVRYHTLNVIYEEIPNLIREGFEVVRLSDLISSRRRN